MKFEGEIAVGGTEPSNKADEKRAKAKARRDAQRAKRAAKRAALVEKRRAAALKKRERKAAIRAKKLARLEKIRANKAAAREKKKLAREKKLAMLKAKKIQMKVKQPAKKGTAGTADFREAAKSIKAAMKHIAAELSVLGSEAISKRAKKLRPFGYDVEVADGQVVVRFIESKSKKLRAEKPVVQPAGDEPAIKKSVAVVDTPDDEPKVELVPAGDLLGTDGRVDDEIATIQPDDDTIVDGDDDDYPDDDDTLVDTRDETNEEIIDARREFFENAEELGEYDN